MATALAVPSAAADYGRYLLGLPTLAVVVAVAVVGGVALGALRAWGEFEIVVGRFTLQGLRLAALLATALAVPILLVDVVLRYPEAINVPMPRALLFYPTIGFVAEVVFHLAPLAVLLLATKPLWARLGKGRVILAALVVAALVEPVFQVLFPGGELALIDAYTAVHVFAISALQLYVFRRYDFVSMYVFRLVYYAYWHIAWGSLRLELLFG